MRQCNHVPRGFVTNQPPGEPLAVGRPHASLSTCLREQCIDNAKSWVASRTNETATFYTFGRVTA